MYFQFLIEDESTKILVDHVMEKIKTQYTEGEIEWDKKFFKGIGHLKIRMLRPAISILSMSWRNGLRKESEGFSKVRGSQ